MGNGLFKNTLEVILLKCISKSKAYLEIFDAHSGSCGAHQVGHKMKWILFRQDFYCSTM